MRYKILVVDDETANLRLLERLFRGTYDVVSASSADEAIELLSVHDISLIISDQRMPGMTGIEFLKIAAEMRPQTVRIMLTGYSDAEALVEAINSGAVYKYITKPWVNDELLQTAKRALQHYETLRGQRQLQMNHERLQNRLRSLREMILALMGDMVASEAPRATDSAYRMREYALRVGRIMDLDPNELEPLGTAAFLLHLTRPGIWRNDNSDSDGTAFKQSIGAVIEAPEFEDVVSILRFADERFDGAGEPNGYIGEEIPVAARILAVAEEFERGLTRGNNGQEREKDEAFADLRSLAGSKLDPEIVDAFCGSDSLYIPTELPQPGVHA